MKWVKSKYTAFTLVMLAAAGMKVWIISSGSVPFNSDEAVVALMARHILQGEKPVFFYGQVYMGSLDAYLISAAFKLLGEQIWVIRAVQALLYLFTVGTTWILAEGIFKSPRAGAAASLLMAIPAVNTTLYTTVTIGGYGEVILLGNLICLLVLHIDNLLRKSFTSSEKSDKRWVSFSIAGWIIGLGILAGIGFWTLGLIVVYLVPVLIFLVWKVWTAKLYREPSRIAGWVFAALIGFIIGSLPWWIYAANHGLAQMLGELGGTVIALEKGSYFSRIAAHLVNYSLLGLPAALGLRPPWEVRWIALPLIPIVFFIWGAVFLRGLRKKPAEQGHPGIWLLAGIILMQLILFILTPYGIDPSGRYFLPIVTPLAVLAGGFVTRPVLNRPILGYLGIGFLILFQFAGNLDSIIRMPPGITTQFNYETRYDQSQADDLQDFLLNHGLSAGYTDYWVSYPLAFNSNEQLIFVPSLPYHDDLKYTERDNRYAPYNHLVGENEKIAYITVNHPPLDEVIRSGFQQLEVTWAEEKIGDYRVFYDLSRAVSPEEIGLGVNTQ